MLDNNLRMIMAYHEASHAVIARVQGIECLCVVMFSPVDGLAAGTRTPISTYRDADQFRKSIIVTLAGPCGEMKHRNKPWSRKYLKRWQSDYENARTAARQAALIATGVDPGSVGSIQPTTEQIAYCNDLLLDCLDTARNLVNEHWLAIGRVAQTLMTCDLLDQIDLDHLIIGRRPSLISIREYVQ
jgi:hypothetical protein